MKYILFTLLFIVCLTASEIAIAKNVKGNVIAKSGSTTHAIHNGSALNDGMVIFTKEKSSLQIIFKDNSEVALGSNSLLNLKKYIFEPEEKKYDFELFLEKGTLSFESGKISELSPENFTLKTPDGTVAIRGTKFFVKVQ